MIRREERRSEGLRQQKATRTAEDVGACRGHTVRLMSQDLPGMSLMDPSSSIRTTNLTTLQDIAVDVERHDSSSGDRKKIESKGCKDGGRRSKAEDGNPLVSLIAGFTFQSESGRSRSE